MAFKFKIKIEKFPTRDCHSLPLSLLPSSKLWCKKKYCFLILELALCIRPLRSCIFQTACGHRRTNGSDHYQNSSTSPAACPGVILWIFSTNWESWDYSYLTAEDVEAQMLHESALCGVGKETMLRLNPFPFLQSFCLIYRAFWATVVVTQTQGRGLCALSRDFRAGEDNRWVQRRRGRAGDNLSIEDTGQERRETHPRETSSASFISRFPLGSCQ